MAQKNVLADGSDLYTKSGTTEFKIATSTGGLRVDGATLIHAPSTEVLTLVGTTETQDLTNKSINKVTVTAPTTGATLTIASGAELKTSGAFQLVLATTVNSLVYMPPTTAESARVLWTTEDSAAKITAKTSEINPLGSVTWPTTGAQTLVNTTDAQTLENKTLGTGVAESVAAGSSAATLPNYGVTTIASSTGAPVTAVLAAPSAGVRKTIYCTYAGSSDTVTIFSGSSACFINTTAANNIVFSTRGVVELMGVSTSQWILLGVGADSSGYTYPTFTTSTT